MVELVYFLLLVLRVREVTERRVFGKDHHAKHVGCGVLWESIRRTVNDDNEMERICLSFVVHPFLFKTLAS